MFTVRNRFLIGLALVGVAAVLGLRQVAVKAQSPAPEQLQEGSQLYAENCAVCHGPNGEGRVGATLAKDWPSIRPELTVREIIANGIPGSVMPAWSQEKGGPFSAEQIDALVMYILSWQTGGAPAPVTQAPSTPQLSITPAPNVEGDPNHGAQLFAQNCAMCHGPNGEGRVGATLAKNWPGIRPDLNVKTTISNGIPGSVMPAWSQANGGPLADQDINDLVAFILSQPAAAVEQPGEGTIPGAASGPAWITSWGGVLFAFVLFILIVSGALIAQRRA